MNMKAAYKILRNEIQNLIKMIAEQSGINPLQAFIKLDEADCRDEQIQDFAVKLYNDFGIDTKTTYEFIEDFKSEIYDFICPEWNSTLECDSLAAYINRTLISNDFDTIPPETIDFLVDEILSMDLVKRIQHK